MTETSDHNPLFDLLATDESGIEGLIAYGLYKRDKRAWLFDFRDREGHEPDGPNEREFLRTVRQSAQLERYRQEARERLIDFAYSVVEEQKPEIMQQAVEGRIEALAQEIANQNKFRRQVAVSVMSTLLTIAVSIVVVAGLTLFGVDIIDAQVLMKETLEGLPR